MMQIKCDCLPPSWHVVPTGGTHKSRNSRLFPGRPRRFQPRSSPTVRRYCGFSGAVLLFELHTLGDIYPPPGCPRFGSACGKIDPLLHRLRDLKRSDSQKSLLVLFGHEVAVIAWLPPWPVDVPFSPRSQVSQPPDFCSNRAEDPFPLNNRNPLSRLAAGCLLCLGFFCAQEITGRASTTIIYASTYWFYS